MKHISTIVAVAVSALVLDAVVSAPGAHAQGTTTGNAAAGKVAFMHYGCYECHGTVGEGNFGAGPALAPHPIPYDGFLGYIRAPRGEMPPFDAHVLPADDAQNIWAYLSSIPAGPAASSIAALRGIDNGNAGAATPPSPEVARGRVIFATYCVKCHVSAPIGPPLANIKAHEALAVTISQIKSPAPPMPKLYPSTLSEQDVDDVAAYVQTL
jgi:ubiquinol-cytochrome c reductase cytochrome c subunit